jgi:hypothetical protein
MDEYSKGAQAIEHTDNQVQQLADFCLEPEAFSGHVSMRESEPRRHKERETPTGLVGVRGKRRRRWEMEAKSKGDLATRLSFMSACRIFSKENFELEAVPITRRLGKRREHSFPYSTTRLSFSHGCLLQFTAAVAIAVRILYKLIYARSNLQAVFKPIILDSSDNRTISGSFEDQTQAPSYRLLVP